MVEVNDGGATTGRGSTLALGTVLSSPPRGRGVATIPETFVDVASTDPMVRTPVAGTNAPGAMLVFVFRDPPERWLDAALRFAAGGVLYVISDEIVPETHARGHERAATIGTVVGVLVTLHLDIAPKSLTL